MSQGETTAAKRYLVVTEESEIAPTQQLVEDKYRVITLRQAMNGQLQQLAGKQVILWPSATMQAHEKMRSFALDILYDAKEVKFLDSSLQLGDTFTASFMVGGEKPWTWDVFKDWANGSTGIVYLHVVPKDQPEGAETMPAEDGAQPLPSVPNSAAQTQIAPNLPPDEQSRAASSSPRGSPAALEASVMAEPLRSEDVPLSTEALPNHKASAGVPGLHSSDHPTGSPDEPPQWATEYAPADAVRQLSADEAYVPYITPDNAWPEPLDLSDQLYVAAPLDLALIPAALRPIVGDFSKRTGIDHAPAFFGFLGAISGLANDFIKLQPKQNDYRWTVRPVVWPFAIGGSSSGKSPALEEGMAILQRKDRELILENTKRRKDYEYAMKQYEDDCAAARKNKAPRPEEPEAPKLREYWVSKGTVEGVTRVLEHSDKVTWYVDEISGLINGWDAYKNGGKGSDREFVLQLWNGGPGKNTLAGRTISIANASAVLCGGSTPTAMLQCAGGKLKNDGFLQRTLLCMVPKMSGGSDTAPDERAYAAYERILNNLLDMPGTATIKLSPDAQQVYNDFCQLISARIHTEDNESIGSHLGKWSGLAPRLMLIYYMIECADRGQFISDGNLVPVEIAQQVCDLLMKWQMSHVSYFWNELMSDKGSRRFSQTITRYIIANPQLQHLNFRDHIARPHWREMEQLKPWELKDAINTLITAAWIVPQGSKNNSHGVPSSYEINPRIEGLFQDERAREIEIRMVKRDELQKLRDAKRERTAGED